MHNIHRTDPACNLQLYLGACTAEGRTFTNAVQTDDLLVNVVAAGQQAPQLLTDASTKDVSLFNFYGWLDLTNNQTCKSQTPNKLPRNFFQGGWITYKYVGGMQWWEPHIGDFECTHTLYHPTTHTARGASLHVWTTHRQANHQQERRSRRRQANHQEGSARRWSHPHHHQAKAQL